MASSSSSASSHRVAGAAAVLAGQRTARKNDVRMNCVTVLREKYLLHVLQEVSGPKILLLDEETKSIVGMVYGLSEIMTHEVFLVEKLNDERSAQDIACVVVVRPIEENVELLTRELSSPRYSEYHLVFTNSLSTATLRNLARSDVHERVKSVQEMFMDFYPVNRDLFSLNMPFMNPLFNGNDDSLLMQRVVDGICASMLALKTTGIVRYQSSSSLVCEIAQQINARMALNKELYHCGRENPPLLLLLDRRIDPITPLLTQWTYQAMAHEYFGIKHNRLKVKHKEIKEELVFSSEQDPFLFEHSAANIADLADSILDLGNMLVERRKQARQLETLDDMQRFFLEFPEFAEFQGHVAKHNTVVQAISSIIRERDLMNVSEVEQEIAVKNDHGDALVRLQGLIMDDRVQPFDAVRVACLYAIRYCRDSRQQLGDIIQRLRRRGVPEDALGMIRSVQAYACGEECSPSLFQKSGVFGFLRKKPKRTKGVDSVYTQHEPLLTNILHSAANGELSTSEFPVSRGADILPANHKPRDIVVFIVGGATFEEALAVTKLNDEFPDTFFVLGGTTIHNTFTYLEEVEMCAQSDLR